MSKTSRIRDNNMYGTVANFLKDKIQDGASLSFVSAYFIINAFNALRDSLTGIDNLRFLFGKPDVIGGMDPSKTESKAFRLTEDGLGLRIAAKRIWLNLELAKKPKSCLVYVLVHKMVHLLERHHNDRFRELMDKFLPQWRTYRDTLNRAPLAHEDWGY